MADVAEQVAALLAASHAAHRQYRAAKPRPQSPGSPLTMPGNPIVAKDALLRASQARDDADRLDPDHTAPAWRDEGQHADLVAFYQQQLAKA